MQQWRTENPAMTFDEVSMERSKSFVKALQELKNLRPQLYSAAEYCEKSYVHNEQKQMVLDNLKDYAVRALVNAVDHLGTVAYKLTDLFEQQTLDISTLELKISCLNQQILTCQTYTDKEGLRQQRMFTNNPRHHKHYILPNSASRQVQSSSQLQKDATLNHVQPKPRPHPPGTPASKTLSWHLASETNSPLNGAPHAASSIGDIMAPKITSEAFHFLDTEDAGAPMPLSTHLRSASGTPTSNMALRSFGIRVQIHWKKVVVTMGTLLALKCLGFRILAANHFH
uniref:Protein ABIL1 isoform X2 n=1 Tax=Elaeis guineensis var. tenera TaxID=51953 RepID=A0A6I9RDF4_ELAGV|nr:protein ABIL1 isoform X2 [Elaeis guineensis]